MAVVGGVRNPEVTTTLLQIEVLWDGKVIGSKEATTGQFLLVGGGTTSSSPGDHTVGIRVVRQTVASAVYEITGTVNSATITTGEQQNIDLGPTQQIFTSGQLVTFAVTLR